MPLEPDEADDYFAALDYVYETFRIDQPAVVIPRAVVRKKRAGWWARLLRRLGH